MVQSFFDIENTREFLEDLGRRHERFPYALFEIAKAGEELHREIKLGMELVKKGEDPAKISIGFHSLAEMIDPNQGFVQAKFDEFDLHAYMLALYDDNTRANHYFPKPCRSDLEPIKIGSELEERVQFLPHGKHFYDESVKRINEKPEHLRKFSGKFMDVFNSLYVGNGFRHLGNFINFLNKGQEMHYECDAFVLATGKEAEFLGSIESVKYLGVKSVPEIPRDAENWFFTNGWSSKTDAYLLIFNDGKKPMVAYLNNGISGEAYAEGELLIANKKGERVTSGKSQISQKDNRVMVSDLNDLESGLGDKVLTLLEEHNSYHGLLRAEEEITNLLGKTGFTASEVYVDRGNRRTHSLTSVFKDHASAYQFADQFDM